MCHKYPATPPPLLYLSSFWETIRISLLTLSWPFKTYFLMSLPICWIIEVLALRCSDSVDVIDGDVVGYEIQLALAAPCSTFCFVTNTGRAEDPQVFRPDISDNCASVSFLWASVLTQGTTWGILKNLSNLPSTLALETTMNHSKDFSKDCKSFSFRRN